MGRGPTETRGAVHIGVALSQSLGSRQAGGGFGDNVRRLVSRAMAGPGKTKVSTTGSVTTYTASGETSAVVSALPAGVYLIDARSSVTFGADCTDLYHRVDISVSGGTVIGPIGGSAATTGNALTAANFTATVNSLEGFGEFTATPTLSGGPGAATVQDVSITATRIASA